MTRNQLLRIDDDQSIRDALGRLFETVALKAELFGSVDEYCERASRALQLHRIGRAVARPFWSRLSDAACQSE